MRAGPLSNKKVIALLNRCFVPVYAVNEDYEKRGAASAGEKAARQEIFKQGHDSGLSVGTVHVYLLSPDGTLIDSMHVAEAAKTDKLLALLDQVVSDLKTVGGAPVVEPKPQSCPLPAPSDSIVLHLTARSLDGRGAWSEFPVENWITFEEEEQNRLLPADSKVGYSWKLAPDLTARLLTHFYPATENNDITKNRFESQYLRGTVISVSEQSVRVHLEGEVKMQHSFYHKDDGKRVQAEVMGYMDVNPATGRIASLRLVTTRATYGGGQFGVGVRSF